MATALITGATAGIGNAFARELARRGNDLVLVARDVDRLESVAADLREFHGIDVEVLPADLSVREQVDKVAARLEDQSRPVDMLVNNAGFGLHASLLDASATDTQVRAFDVMCLAVLILGGAAGRAMKQRGHGRIINVASTSSVIYSGNYSPIKAWARSYSTALALELRRTGVTVTGLLPGWVHTEFHDRAGISNARLPGFVWIDVDLLVRECLEDAYKGRIESIPSLKWRAAMFIGDHGPRGLTRLLSYMLVSSRKKH